MALYYVIYSVRYTSCGYTVHRTQFVQFHDLCITDYTSHNRLRILFIVHFHELYITNYTSLNLLRILHIVYFHELYIMYYTLRITSHCIIKPHHIYRFLFSSCSPHLQACSKASEYPCNVHPTTLSSEVGRASHLSI